MRRGRGEAIDEIGREFWKLAEAGEFNFRVARPAGWDTVALALWNEELIGSPSIERLRSGRGEQVVREIGRAIALIAGSRIKPKRVFDYAEQLKDTAEFAQILVRRFPGLTSTVKFLLRTFEKVDLPERGLTPIHGDMHIDQWLTNGEELGLLDLEDVSLGHPERDLAFFAVQIESEYGTELDHAVLNAVLMDGYQSTGSRPHERLLRVYAANKWLSKASKLSDVVLAKVFLRRAFNCLEIQNSGSARASGSRIIAHVIDL